MVKDFKRWTTQLAATVLYNGRGAANLLGADAAYPDRFYFTFGLAGLGAAHLVRSVFGTDDLWLAVSVWLGTGAFR